MAENLKSVDGKCRLDLLPWEALEQIADAFEHGAIKYDVEDWRNLGSWRMYLGATLRHVGKWAMGQDMDPDTGGKVHHLAMAGACIMILLTAARVGLGRDDRAGKS